MSKETTAQTTSAAPALSAPEDRPARAAALMVFALCLLAFQDALIKLYSADISLWQFQFVRSACNLALLLLFVRIAWQGTLRWPERIGPVVARSLLLVGAMVMLFGGIPFLTLSEIAAGLYVFPLFVTVLSGTVLGERVGPRRASAVIAGFAGALLILKPGTEGFSFVSLMPVAAGLFYATMVLVTRRYCRRESPATLACGVAIAFFSLGSLGLIVFEIAQPTELSESWPFLFTGWSTLSWPLFGIIVFCSCINLTSNISLARAYQSAESSWLVPFDYSYLVFATLWGIALFGDVPDALSVAGMLMIAGSGVYVAWRERQLSTVAKR